MRKRLTNAVLHIREGYRRLPLVYLSSPNEAGFKCNNTAIYPGQTFGSVALNSTFTYTSLDGFTYSRQPLTNCSPAPGPTFDIITPPLSWPRMTWNHTVQCNVDGPLRAKFTAARLDHFCTTDPSYMVSIWDQMLSALHNITEQSTCANAPVLSFRVEEGVDAVMLLSATSTDILEGLAEHPDVRQLRQTVKDAIAYDFDPVRGGVLSPLPDVLYPCVSTREVRAPVKVILGLLYVGGGDVQSGAVGGCVGVAALGGGTAGGWRG